MGWKGCWTGFPKSVESFVTAMWSGRGCCICFYSCVGSPCVSVAVLAASNTTSSNYELMLKLGSAYEVMISAGPGGGVAFVFIHALALRVCLLLCWRQATQQVRITN